MRQAVTSSSPLTSISTMPPPAEPLARRFLISSVSLSICPPISWACFSRAPRFGKPFEHRMLLFVDVRRFLDVDERLGPESSPARRTIGSWPPPCSRCWAETARLAGAASGASSLRVNSTTHPLARHLGQRLLEPRDLLRPLTDALATEYAGLNETTSRLGGTNSTRSNRRACSTTMPESRANARLQISVARWPLSGMAGWAGAG